MSIMVMLASDSSEDEAALNYTFGLSKRLNVPLDAISAMPDPSTAFVFAASEYAVGVGALAVDKVREAQDETIAAMTEMFERVRDAFGVATERAHYEHLVTRPEDAAGSAAVLSDGIIFPHSAARGEHALSSAFEHVLVDLRLPVLLSGLPEQKEGPVVIAWDGSPEATRAVIMHEALIRKHAHAVIAQNPDDLKSGQTGDAANPQRLAKWLAVRDVSTEICAFSGKVAQGLVKIADETEADLIVAGAYGHSRTGEFLFGGATRSLLREKDAPALALSH